MEQNITINQYLCIYTRQMLLHVAVSPSPFVATVAFSVTACNVNTGINVCML